MVTGKPHDPPPLQPFPPSASSPSQPVVAFSPPSKRDLASWWRQFKRNTRREEPKGMWFSYTAWPSGQTGPMARFKACR